MRIRWLFGHVAIGAESRSSPRERSTLKENLPRCSISREHFHVCSCRPLAPRTENFAGTNAEADIVTAGSGCTFDEMRTSSMSMPVNTA